MFSLKKIAVFSVLFSIIILACQSSTSEEVILEEPKEPSIMYEASELASLMRAMHEQSNSWKSTLISNNDLKVDFDFPDFYLRMHEAEATNPNEINENYYQKAEVFLEHTKKFVQAEKEEKIAKYNLMIASCIDCHKDFCRGPIQKINKLVIE